MTTEKQMLAALKRVRAAAMALPDVTERLSHGAPTFFAGGKTFVMFHDDHHGDGRLALWVAAPPGVQPAMIDEDPEQFFFPPYVGGRGWLGVRLDRKPDWDEINAVITEAFRCVAPKKLLNRLEPRVTSAPEGKSRDRKADPPDNLPTGR
jgi:hypothetical protein